MNSLNLKIEGMHCAACVTRVAKAITGVPGVITANVEIGSAAITAETASAESVLAALHSAGFTARVVGN